MQFLCRQTYLLHTLVDIYTPEYIELYPLINKISDLCKAQLSQYTNILFYRENIEGLTYTERIRLTFLIKVAEEIPKRKEANIYNYFGLLEKISSNFPYLYIYNHIFLDLITQSERKRIDDKYLKEYTEKFIKKENEKQRVAKIIEELNKMD